MRNLGIRNYELPREPLYTGVASQVPLMKFDGRENMGVSRSVIHREFDRASASEPHKVVEVLAILGDGD